MTRHGLMMIACATAFALPAAAAPSFDCAKASGPIEKAICRSADLSAADKKLADTYNGVLVKVSDTGRAILRDGQRQWIAYSRTLCVKPAEGDTVESCLKGLYDDRQKEIAESVTVAGGVKFVRAVLYKAHKEVKTADNEMGFQPFSTLQVMYPQIESPKSKSDEAFNKAMAQDALAVTKDFKDGGTDFTYGYDTVTVSDRLISVDTSIDFYGHGAAHPNHGAKMFHWMRAESRRMKPEDLFAANTGWMKFLREFVYAKVKDNGMVEKPEALNDMVKDPGRWAFAKEGLTLRFNPYDVASYADGPQEVVIPWKALKPFLAKNPPVKF